jgi:hypothetical protein
MTSLNHILAGTAIALSVRSPVLAAALAFLSHFVLDAFPHFGYKWPGWSFWHIWAIDAVLSVLALVLLCAAAPDLCLIIITGGVFAELPDVLWLYENIVRKGESRFWFFRFHHKIQWAESQRGLLYEVGYAVALTTVNVWLLNNSGNLL